MGYILSLTATKKNDLPFNSAIGVDIGDISRVIEEVAGFATIYVIERTSTAQHSSRSLQTKYTLSIDLATLVVSSGLISLNVVSVQGRLRAGTPAMGFNPDRITSVLYPTVGGGCKFMYEEEGYAQPIEYQVTQNIPTVSALTAASSGSPDEKVKVSVLDTVASYLSSKLTSTDLSISFNILNPGGNEVIDISAIGAFTLDIGDLIGASTTGSVLFVGAAGDLQQDNANFFWDDTANMLGLGMNAPTERLMVNGNISSSSNDVDQLGTTLLRWNRLWMGDTGQAHFGLNYIRKNPGGAGLEFQLGSGTGQWNMHVNGNELFFTGAAQQMSIDIQSSNANNQTRWSDIGIVEWWAAGKIGADFSIGGIVSALATEIMRVSGVTGNTGFGTPAPDASALVDVFSTTKGFLIPRMTNAQMLAIGAPASGLQVYDVTNNQFMGYNGTLWVILG